MELSKETESIQNSLAMYCRSGIETQIPVSRPENLVHYRKLVFNIVLNTMEQAFPITYKNLSSEEWKNLVNDFFLNHDSQTPQVWKLPFEFYQFVSEHNFAKKLKKPYLNDLLLFEWIEIEVHTMPDIEASMHNPEGNLFTDILVLNPEFKLITINYPVHIHPPEKTIDQKGNYYLIAFRHPEELNVKFLNLSILHAYIIEKLAEEKYSMNQVIEEALSFFNVNKNELITNISTFLNDLLEQKLILGYKINN